MAQETDELFLYDVAVVYTAATLAWAKRLGALCERWGCSTFLFDRDAQPGAAIADNWTESLVASRRVLLLASADLDRDEWAQFAGLVAHSFSPAGRAPRLAVIKLQECRAIRNFAVFNMIDYTKADRRDFFWLRVYHACTGLRVRRQADVPGFEGLGQVPEVE